MTEVRILRHKSAIGEKVEARRTLAALGLRRTGSRAVHQDTPALRGMLRKVAHLVTIEDQKP